ncbi:MAG: AAA domain-containing protein [Burkholderiales bacterium]
MSHDLAPGATLVLDLLSYIEQVEKLKSKPAFSVPTEFFVAYQHELRTLPGIQFNLQSDGDDIWLRIPRLREIAPPEPEDVLRPWIILPKNPEKIPELRQEVARLEGKREVGREILDDHPGIRELFDWYVRNQWTPWALAEQPRRKTIVRYNKLFALHQAIMAEGAETPLELAWGIGYASWKKEGVATPVRHPLIVQACEISLDEQSFDLEVRPRDVEPRLEVDCYVAMEIGGVAPLEAFWRNVLSTGANRVNPFESSTFNATLKAAVGYLDPSGAYTEDLEDPAPPAPGDKLTVSRTWVLFGRKRSGDVFLEDIRRLKKKVEQAEALPNVIRSLVEVGDSTVKVRPEQPFRGLSTSDGGAVAKDLYFPMPYNDEQVSIVQKLHTNDGVVVQGPPGTGKTHTIANVICHYLAQGQRVLVTAKGETALAVLQEKLPEAIRPLSVSLLSDERDGMKQFEHSIQAIASQVSDINPARSEARIRAAEEELNRLHAKISQVDRAISDFAANHMRSYTYHGRTLSPEELARTVIDGSVSYEWFDDLPSSEPSTPPGFDDDAVNSVRRARMAVGDDLRYVGCRLPSTDSLPSWEDVLALHRDVVKAKAIEGSVASGATLPLMDSRTETFERARSLLTFLEERIALKARLSGIRQPWLGSFAKRLTDLQQTDPLLQSLVALGKDVRDLEQQRRRLLSHAVDIPPNAELNQDVQDAVHRLCSGKSAFGLPFGKGEARRLLAAMAIGGGSPRTDRDWAMAKGGLDWRLNARKCLSKWTALSAEFGLPAAEAGVDASFKAIVSLQALIDDSIRLVFEYDSRLHSELEQVYGRTAADKVWDGGEPFIARAYASVQAHVDKERLSYALRRIQEFIRSLEGHAGAVVEELRQFLQGSLGKERATEPGLEATWRRLRIELARLAGLRPWFDEIARVAEAIESAGAPKWAARLRSVPASADLDPVAPTDWRDAWEWRQAVRFLDRIDGHQTLRTLFDERQSLTRSLARTYQELVAEKTWLGVFRNSPDSVRQALQAYLNAVQAMGAGTGIRAVRYRRNAREAMSRAYQAVPCWVLPHWRVSETIPPEVGLFDLVVIDEASQSDIWALPSLLRGRKVLVVGDHKQVSPSAVGTAEEKIKELVGRFLTSQPFGSEMTPEKSIYDLARVVFAGNSVMLKEHFRCVPAIIEFSNREFYQGDIRPLRLPKSTERLDPPLVDVFVKGGHRNGDVNAAEAKAIVDEIKSILADPVLDGRSLGVVTLLGNEQAAHIHELVSEQISPVDVVNRKIAIGPPPVFQGRERDIMLVSMVIAAGDRAAASRADMHQRFNVALSRARDRMYLFRSVTDNDVKEDSLNGKVIRHFKQPFQRDSRKVDALRERCESGFEREMFDELVRRGFCVQPQVECGAFRIDLVIEGRDGRRLAVECDGDRFHGPGQWQDDMARQRVLERAGWTFWRCFASSFVRRRRAVLDDLMLTLEHLGIEAIGSDVVDTSVWVTSRDVDPFGVDQSQEAG